MTDYVPRNIDQVPAHPGWDLRDIQLEMSLKPFYDNTSETREAVVAEIFHQWQALWRHAESVSVMLWIGEGSEILEYEGIADREFEWARYHGAANHHRWNIPARKKGGKKQADHVGIGSNIDENDPEGIGLHSRCYLYRDQPARFTFNWLRDLVSDIKRIGGDITGRKIFVGETFDIGPEFAKSRFKFEWHREILGDGPLFKEQFISCEAVLKGDDRAYAAYPNGIPDGTRFGTFLGKQLHALFHDIGFDFLWFSNGFGFSLEPWAMVGEVFDGEAYHPERSAGIQDRILRFWQDLRAEFPVKYGIRSRGTNLATGIDLGSDASPLKYIYEGGFHVDAPVNSPWAALDGDFGLELSGWMSHVAQHPGDTFRFRFYIHDAWWMNSPWLDRYGRQPHDIYLPLSVSRVQEDGEVETPRDIAFLSVDDSHGMMPHTVPNEVIAHILAAREKAPDAAGPLIWVYPFDDFHELTLNGGRPDLPLHADAFIGAVINEGVPLNTVMDAGDFARAWETNRQALQGSILVTPAPVPGSAHEKALAGAWQDGADVLCYGPVSEGSFLQRTLGIELLEALDGDFEFHSETAGSTDDVGNTLRHTSFLSGGAFMEVSSHAGYIRATAQQEGSARTAIAAREASEGTGRLAWTRASLTTDEFDPEDPQPIRGPILRALDTETFYPPGRLLRDALSHFGWNIEATVTPMERRQPYLVAHRYRNGLILSGYHRDEHAVLRVRHPLGAPLLNGRINRITKGKTEISGRTAWQNEVRVFAATGGDAVIRCQDLAVVMHDVHRRMLISGCEDATLVFLVETGHTDKIRILRDPHFPYYAGEFVDPVVQSTPHGDAITIEHVDGELMIEF